MRAVTLDKSLLRALDGKTAIVTGAGGGIGAEIVKLLALNGAKVVLADLDYARKQAEQVIASLADPSRAFYVPTDITNWKQTETLFKEAKAKFGSIEVVVANAGVIESEMVLDVDRVDDNGDLLESLEYSRVVDINLKGTMNTLRQAIFQMKDNSSWLNDGSRGSIILVSSTSGYFGATGVAGYISTKHGVTGLLRGSQVAAKKHSLRINAVAPFVTPTAFTGGFTEAWTSKGLPFNTREGVAEVVCTLACDPAEHGSCYVTCGPILREIEHTRNDVLASWLGEDFMELMATAAQFFREQGGYKLPQLAAIKS